MRAVHTEEFFRKYKEELFQKYKRDCDYEHDLYLFIPDFKELPQEQKEKATEALIKVYAPQVAETAKKELLKKMHGIKEIKAGRAGLGYTTTTQEISAMHDLVEGFEFSCFMLAEFKKKYNL